MTRFHSIRKGPYTAAQMFAVVADVERYPEFLPLCEALKILSREQQGDEEIIVAEMTVAYGVFTERLTSRARLDPVNLKIFVEYLAGPLSHLESRWSFRDLDEGGSETEFDIDYEFSTLALRLAVGAAFDRAFRRFSDAFARQAKAVYGNQGPDPV